MKLSYSAIRQVLERERVRIGGSHEAAKLLAASLKAQGADAKPPDDVAHALTDAAYAKAVTIFAMIERDGVLRERIKELAAG